MDHCIQTSHEPHDDKYKITFDISLFEKESVNTRRRGRSCSDSCGYASSFTFAYNLGHIPSLILVDVQQIVILASRQRNNTLLFTMW